MQIERFQWQHSVLKCSCCASIVDDWSTARSMTKARDESLWPSVPNRKGNAVRLNKYDGSGHLLKIIALIIFSVEFIIVAKKPQIVGPRGNPARDRERSGEGPGKARRTPGAEVGAEENIRSAYQLIG